MSQRPCARCGIPFEAAGRRLLCDECRTAPRDRRERTENALERLIAAEAAATPSLPDEATANRLTPRQWVGRDRDPRCAGRGQGR